MALPVSNNNNGLPITGSGTYCTIQVPGYIPPEIAGPGGSSPQFASVSYHIETGSTGVGTVVIFQMQGSDGVWRSMTSPPPITCTSGTIYNGTSPGNFHAVRLNVAVAGNGLAYAQLSGTPHSPATSVPGPQGDPGPQGVPGPPGATGPPGPTAVSADADNQAILGTDGLIFVPAAVSGTSMTELYIDQDGGDLIVKSITGPNAGKSVNLTFGHWKRPQGRDKHAS